MTLNIDLAQPGKPIRADLVGIFFEDINYAADGGLYAELIQNQSFGYQATEIHTWNPLTSWELVERGCGKGPLGVDASDPVHPNNPLCAVLQVVEPGDGVGLLNPGFDGIPVKAGERYDFSAFARHLYTGHRWAPVNAIEDAAPESGGKPPLLVRIESKGGEVLGESAVQMPGREWTRLTTTITASRTDADARFVLLMNFKGGLALDVISLFPQKTLRNRPNGLRADLAQATAVRDRRSGDVILKLVNGSTAAKTLTIELTGAENLPVRAEATVLVGEDPKAVNDYPASGSVLPQTSTLTISGVFDYHAPANSLTILRVKPHCES